MIDKIDEQLKRWATTLTPECTITLGPPDRKSTGSEVNVYLIDLLEYPPVRGSKVPPLQFLLRYLVSAVDPDPLKAHQLLEPLIFSALERPEFQVEFGPISIDLWSALSVAPRPAFFLRVPVRRDRPERVVPLVRTAMVQQAPMASLHGYVYGPNKVPLMGAQIDWSSLKLHAETDHRGHFQFRAVPSTVPVKLMVRAKGKELIQDFEAVERLQQPIAIHISTL
jgi:hypothetical protein